MSEHKQKEASELILNQEVPITLLRRQWIVVFNVIVSQAYKLGDAKIINEIIDKIEPVAAVDSNIKPEEGVVVNN